MPENKLSTFLKTRRCTLKGSVGVGVHQPKGLIYYVPGAREEGIQDTRLELDRSPVHDLQTSADDFGGDKGDAEAVGGRELRHHQQRQLGGVWDLGSSVFGPDGRGRVPRGEVPGILCICSAGVALYEVIVEGVSLVAILQLPQVKTSR